MTGRSSGSTMLMTFCSVRSLAPGGQPHINISSSFQTSRFVAKSHSQMPTLPPVTASRNRSSLARSSRLSRS